MTDPCEGFAEKLVDYADGELPEGESRAVAHHLAACERCRRTVQTLDRSLGLAKVLWSANLDDDRPITTSLLWPASRRVRLYAVVASILIAASTLLFTVPTRRPQESPIRFEEVEQQIARAGMAAELLVATRMVAHCEGTESIVEQQYRYILSEYADTAAAESIKASHNQPLGGTHND